MNRDDKKDPILHQYEASQREFENHALWKRLGMKPDEFFDQLDRQVVESGIPPQVWRQKLNETRQIIETRVRESHRLYTHTPRNLAAIRV